MFDLESLLKSDPFSFDKEKKAELYSAALGELIQFHYQNCEPYKKILDAMGVNPGSKMNLEALPFLPVRLFKAQELRSIPKEKVIKTMTSSGTTGQSVSRIYLDAQTAANQTKVLAKITSHFLGNKRLPMLIIDSPSVIKDRAQFSARGAGILGFSILGTNVTYALDEKMQINWQAIENFSAKYSNGPVLVFGFTFMIWQYFYKALANANRKVSLNSAIMLHGGGWKKLSHEAVDNDTFKAWLKDVSGISRIHNYYGMVEQTGSIFMECEKGVFHSSVFSDILIRRKDFSLCAKNEPGLVELVSLLPSSYPGHVLLSEDLGEITGEDNCPCGRLGKTFKIHGRIAQAEARGCGDTFTS